METALDKSGTQGKQDGYASRSRALACMIGTELDRELVRRGSRSPTSSFALASRFCSAQRTRYRLKFAGCGVDCITRHDRGLRNSWPRYCQSRREFCPTDQAQFSPQLLPGMPGMASEPATWPRSRWCNPTIADDACKFIASSSSFGGYALKVDEGA
jgi:hypothetical protein